MANYIPDLFDSLYYRAEIKETFGNRKNWSRFCEIASRLWWRAYTARLLCTRV